MRDGQWVGERERKREGESLQQAPLSVRSLRQGSISQCWDHELRKSRVEQLIHPGIPEGLCF